MSHGQRLAFRFITLLIVLAPIFSTAAASKAALTREQAKARIAEAGFGEDPVGLLAYLQTSSPDAVEITEAYLALGVKADEPITFRTTDGQTLSALPLNYLLRYSCDSPITARLTKLLVDAGADVSASDPDNYGMTPAMATVGCDDVLEIILAQKPDLTITNGRGQTAMHFAVNAGKPTAVRMLLDAGFDIGPWKTELIASAGYDPAIRDLLQGKTPAPVTATPGTAGATDWTSTGPYPAMTQSAAKELLSRPGDDTTIDDHLWDGITSREPLRVALALRAGADVRQKRAVTGYTPLVLLAERCDANEDVEQQVSVAAQLIAAGADLTGLDANRGTALTLAAGNCPAGVVQLLIKAGVPVTGADSTGTTPLRNAIVHDRPDNVAALLDAGVDPKKEPYNVKAFASGKKEIEELLKKRRK